MEQSAGRVSSTSLQGKELGEGEFAKRHHSNISLSNEKMLYPLSHIRITQDRKKAWNNPQIPHLRLRYQFHLQSMFSLQSPWFFTHFSSIPFLVSLLTRTPSNFLQWLRITWRCNLGKVERETIDIYACHMMTLLCLSLSFL